MSKREVWGKAKSLIRVMWAWSEVAVFHIGKLLGPPTTAVQRELSRDDVKQVLGKAMIGLGTGTGLSWHGVQEAFLKDKDVLQHAIVPLGFAVVLGLLEAMTLYAHGQEKPKEAAPPPPTKV